MLGGAKLGMNIRIATPPGYEPNAGVMETTKKLAAENVEPTIPWLYNYKLDFRFR